MYINDLINMKHKYNAYNTINFLYLFKKKINE